MKPFSRSDRVGGLIQRVLSEILRRDIKDPRLELTTISAVKMSPDLKIAKIYYTTPSGKNNKESVAAGFHDAAGFMKRALAREINLRYMPALQFYVDESFDYGSRIDQLINSLKTDESDNKPLE